ncbi:urease accessory UreF family protein [Paenibacillus sp. SAF-054]|uniref:urease accessory UreF family protein n=1 Tax=unclassified Paenibacillus TaxID=185978 RepID=UPI003F7FF191
MNDKSTKLLDYVQLLDHDLSIGGFSCLSDIRTRIADGRIQSKRELEEFFLHPMRIRLVDQDSSAIQSIYKAAELSDSSSIANTDKLLGRLTKDEYTTARKQGARQFKLAQALYPWLNLGPLENIVREHFGPTCLATIHAYINYQLGIGCDQAVHGYIRSGVNACVVEAASSLHIPRSEADILASHWTVQTEKAWLTKKDSLTQEAFDSFTHSHHHHIA